MGANVETKPFRVLASILFAACLAAAGARAEPPAIAQSGVRGTAASPTHPRLVSQIEHRQPVNAIALSRDGSLLATGSDDQKVVLWDVASGRKIRPLSGHTESVRAVALDHQSVAAKRCVSVGSDKAAIVWDVASGKRLHTLRGHDGTVTSVEVGPHNQYVLTGAADGKAILWDLESGTLIREFPHGDWVRAVAFSSDGKRVATACSDRSATVWDVKTGTSLHAFTHLKSVNTVAFALGDEQIWTGCADGSVKSWTDAGGSNLQARYRQSVQALAITQAGRPVVARRSGISIGNGAAARRLTTLTGQLADVRCLAVSDDGTRIAAGAGNSAFVWRSSQGRWDEEACSRPLEFSGYGSSVSAVAVSSRIEHVAVGSRDGSLLLWRHSGGGGLLKRMAHADPVKCVAFSPDGRWLISGSRRGEVCWWDGETLEKQHFVTPDANAIRSLAFSPTGRFFVTVSDHARLWDTNRRRQIQDFYENQSILSAACTDEPFVLIGGYRFPVTLQDGRTKQELRTFAGIRQVQAVALHPSATHVLWASENEAFLQDKQGHSKLVLTHEAKIASARFSPQGSTLLTVSSDGNMKLWDLQGQQLLELDSGSPAAWADFLRRGEFVGAASENGLIQIWRTRDGSQLLQLFVADDRHWFVVDREGRFDTDHLEQIRGLNWLFPDDPLRPLPPEIFLRDYYEPRLLSRLLAEEEFPPIRPLASVNRVQPQVEIKSVKVAHDKASVEVTVTVSGHSGTFLRDGQEVVMTTGAHDLRLFRDGQRVAIWTGGERDVPTAVNSSQEGLQAWRCRTQITPDEPATGQFTVRLPRNRAGEQVSLSAYAFNEDRVLSNVTTTSYTIPNDVQPIRPKAFLLTVGVDQRKLRFAAADARAIHKKLAGLLKNRYDVVVVPLISTTETADGELPATKSNFRRVLDTLAGRRSSVADFALPAGLDRAGPDDLVMVFFASHGYSAGGLYYFFPADIGDTPLKGNPRLLSKCISSDELSRWLSNVDAGELVLILDTCHAAGAVDQPGFKAGPLGIRGFGQLAYDKRMRVLAATRRDANAIESDRIGHGLLTHVLLKPLAYQPTGEADRVTLANWLRYGAENVVRVGQEVRRGLTGLDPPPSTVNKGLTNLDPPNANKPGRLVQTPVLFDFQTGNPGVTLREYVP